MKLDVRKVNSNDCIELSIMNEEFNEIRISAEKIKEKILKSNEIIAIAEYDCKVVGFACAQIFESICYNYNIMEVTELYVKEKFRRLGCGKALMEFIEKEGKNKNVGEIRLETGMTNKNAQIIYKSLGYERKRRIVFEKTMK